MHSLPKDLKFFIMSMLTKAYLFRITADKALRDIWLNTTRKSKISSTKRKKTMASLQNY
jgi:hypothetical protein